MEIKIDKTRKSSKSTHNKGLVKLGAQQAFFPVVAHDAADGLGQALLDGKVHAGAVVDKLGVHARVVLHRRRKARRRRLLRLAGLPAARRVHDDGLRERCARQRLRPRHALRRVVVVVVVLLLVRLRLRLGLGLGLGLGWVWGLRVLQRRRVRLLQWRERCGRRGRRRLLLLLWLVVRVLLLLPEVVVVMIRRRNLRTRLWGRVLKVRLVLVRVRMRVRVRVWLWLMLRLELRSGVRVASGRGRWRNRGWHWQTVLRLMKVRVLLRVLLRRLWLLSVLVLVLVLVLLLGWQLWKLLGELLLCGVRRLQVLWRLAHGGGLQRPRLGLVPVELDCHWVSPTQVISASLSGRRCCWPRPRPRRRRRRRRRLLPLLPVRCRPCGRGWRLRRRRSCPRRPGARRLRPRPRRRRTVRRRLCFVCRWCVSACCCGLLWDV